MTEMPIHDDPQRLTDTASVRLDPQTVDLSFQSNPTGLQLTVGSSAAAAPFTRTVKDQPPSTYTASRSVSAGDHVLSVEYYEHSEVAVARPAISP